MSISNENDPDKVSELYKYTIWKLWQNLTRAEQMRAKKLLPTALNVSKATIFHKWMYYKKSDCQMIPADAIYQLATFFGVNYSEMFTELPTSLHSVMLQVKNGKELEHEPAGSK